MRGMTEEVTKATGSCVLPLGTGPTCEWLELSFFRVSLPPQSL